MKWNGMVSQCENTRMRIRFTTENRTQATSTQATRHGQLKVPRSPSRSRARDARALARRLALLVKASPAGSECHSPAGSGARGRDLPGPPGYGPGSAGPASIDPGASGAGASGGGGSGVAPLRGELISLTTHRLDQAEAEFRAKAADADVDHVGTGIEVVSPHRGEQLPFGYRLPRVFHQLTEQQELQAGERYRAVPDAGFQPAEIKHELSCPEDLVHRVAVVAEPDPDPGQQFGQGERLGQVVLGSQFQAIHLSGDVSQAGEHEDGLVGPLAPEPGEDLPPVHVRHDQVQDDQVIVAGGGLS